MLGRHEPDAASAAADAAANAVLVVYVTVAVLAKVNRMAALCRNYRSPFLPSVLPEIEGNLNRGSGIRIRRTLWNLRLRINRQVSQHAREALLVGVVIVPAPEVADVAVSAPDRRRVPAGLRDHWNLRRCRWRAFALASALRSTGSAAGCPRDGPQQKADGRGHSRRRIFIQIESARPAASPFSHRSSNPIWEACRNRSAPGDRQGVVGESPTR
jgi:hypothetical protein